MVRKKGFNPKQVIHVVCTLTGHKGSERMFLEKMIDFFEIELLQPAIEKIFIP